MITLLERLVFVALQQDQALEALDFHYLVAVQDSELRVISEEVGHTEEDAQRQRYKDRYKNWALEPEIQTEFIKVESDHDRI